MKMAAQSKGTRRRKGEVGSDPSRPAFAKKGKSVQPWLHFLILALSVLLMIAWLSRSTADADLWWHLKTGEFVWSQHKLPVPDPFGWTTYLGKPLYPGE